MQRIYVQPLFQALVTDKRYFLVLLKMCNFIYYLLKSYSNRKKKV